MLNSGKHTYSCVYSKRCDLTNQLKTSTKNIWINTYCNGAKQSSCKRRALQNYGLKAPENLLPNGTYIEYKRAGG